MQTPAIGARRVFAPNGEIDLATLPALHNALARHVRESRGDTVVVDLDGVTTCDDAGLGVLLGAAASAREAGGDMIVVCSAGALCERLERTGFDRAVHVVPSVAAADRSVR